ncbi:hypothetical protein EON82_04560 [bacterium]|nr:MAG: hypothetical protein EON82_04560 [bacterium]
MKRFLALLLVVVPFVASAHDVPCPVCGLKVVQATKSLDNEVVLRYGRKKIEYRCVYCALADAKKYDGDLIVYAPSETKGKPVLLQRAAGKWSTVKEADGKLVPEEGVVFINDFKSHAKCAALSRAFHSKEALDKYVAENKVENAKALTLDEIVAVVSKS